MGLFWKDIFTKYDKPDNEYYQFYSVRSDSNHTDEDNKILMEYNLERKSGNLVGDENGKLLSAHFVVFHTITSAEQLKDYYLAIGGYGAKDIINEGEWKLSFNLTYEDTSRSYAINKGSVTTHG